MGSTPRRGGLKIGAPSVLGFRRAAKTGARFNTFLNGIDYAVARLRQPRHHRPPE